MVTCRGSLVEWLAADEQTKCFFFFFIDWPCSGLGVIVSGTRFFRVLLERLCLHFLNDSEKKTSPRPRVLTGACIPEARLEHVDGNRRFVVRAVFCGGRLHLNSGQSRVLFQSVDEGRRR